MPKRAMLQVREKLTHAGFASKGSSDKELGALSQSEYERMGKVARSANMTMD